MMIQAEAPRAGKLIHSKKEISFHNDANYHESLFKKKKEGTIYSSEDTSLPTPW